MFWPIDLLEQRNSYVIDRIGKKSKGDGNMLINSSMQKTRENK